MHLLQNIDQLQSAFLGVVPMFSVMNLTAWLTSSSSSSATPTVPGGILAWFICYRARRNEIGGWLLFFYWQLYGGLLMTALLFSTNLQSYVAENFEDSQRFYLFLLSVVPSLILYLAQVAVGTILLSVRAWDVLQLLRWVTAGQVAAAILSI